jgi:dolichol-phosphate mannosyltransferase
MMRITGRGNKFLIVGLSAAIVNISLMILLVDGFGYRTFFLKNLANLLSIEISIVYHFVLSRAWTWRDAPRKEGRDLIAQCLSFHAANLVGMAARVIIFATLERLGIYYIFNVTVGIGVAAAVSFVLYDRIVFKRPMDEKPSL